MIHVTPRPGYAVGHIICDDTTPIHIPETTLDPGNIQEAMTVIAKLCSPLLCAKTNTMCQVRVTKSAADTVAAGDIVVVPRHLGETFSAPLDTDTNTNPDEDVTYLLFDGSSVIGDVTLSDD